MSYTREVLQDITQEQKKICYDFVVALYDDFAITEEEYILIMERYFKDHESVSF